MDKLEANAYQLRCFIDFALGQYEKPEVGIEFSLKFSWSHEEITFDSLKLMDGKNPFKTSISLNIVLRKGRLCRVEDLKDLKKHMNAAYSEAVDRLGRDVCIPGKRDLYPTITEIAQDNSRRHWCLNKGSGKFEIGLPK